MWWWCWAGKGVKDRLLGCLDLKAEARGFGVGHNVLGGDVSDLRGGGMGQGRGARIGCLDLQKRA